MRRTARSLSDALSPACDLVRFDLARPGRPGAWRALREGAPDALLYVPGPSWKSLALLRSMKLASGAGTTACLSLNPEGLGPDGLVRRLLPDLVFVHSEATEARFDRLGAHTQALPIGVDLARFRPPSGNERGAARARLGLEGERPVALHVGHLKAGRNLAALIPLTETHDVVVVGSTATPADRALVERLERAGVRVVHTYLPAIEEAYRAADVYVFPVASANNATEVPLSILEALASGVPVVTTPYGAVPRLLGGRPGVAVTSADALGQAVRNPPAASPKAIRDAVGHLAWPSIAEQVLAALDREGAHARRHT